MNLLEHRSLIEKSGYGAVDQLLFIMFGRVDHQNFIDFSYSQTMLLNDAH